ncbi:hypothetical protein AAFC00_004129 [Neodothiora populina]|uniref:Mitochondrial transcription factor 1 n=1 Tax=Neodothiora populina TaxID=2781224 RepID=A0ABR3PIN2_9PEZI
MATKTASNMAAVLDTTKKFPLSKTLASIFPYDTLGFTRRIKVSDTIDIVSPDLCDDVLNYIGPSLEEYKGCDIIDIHPGACLWSQKLHDFLKPRRHLLMEPDQRYYEPFVEPLLTTPGSTYRHTLLSGAHPKEYFSSYEQIFNDEELLYKKKPLAAGDPQLRKPNKSILVTGTLSRRYRDKRSHINHVNHANMLLNHMVHASQTNSLFHVHGLVRMLFWHPDISRTSVIPGMASIRSGFSAALDAAADLVEVAGRDRSIYMDEDEHENRLSGKYRKPDLEILSAENVMEKMERKGMHMPACRQPILYKAALQRKGLSPAERADTLRAQPIAHLPEDFSLPEALDAHEERLKNFCKVVLRTTKSPREVLDFPYKYKFPESATKTLKEKERARIGPFMDIWGDHLALEVVLAKQKSKSPDKVSAEVEQKLRRLAVQLREAFLHKNMIAKQSRVHAQSMVNEAHAFDTKMLAHDRRPYETLVVESNEFWPRFGMFLLDIQPRQENMADEVMSAVTASTTMRELVTALFQLHASSVAVALDRMAPNAAQDLLPQAPSIMDASKGGRLDAEDMTVRMLTRDMIRELTSAYLEWPFKPDSTEDGGT